MREISIEEMPQGCVLHHDSGKAIVVSSPEDADAIIKSLQRMIAAQPAARRTAGDVRPHRRPCICAACEDYDNFHASRR